MHQQNALAAKGLKCDSPSRKVGEFKGGEIALKRKPCRFSYLSSLLLPNSRGLRLMLELIQTQQYPTLLLDDLVKAYPKADQDQQEEH
jgi:hypothetical protein